MDVLCCGLCDVGDARAIDDASSGVDQASALHARTMQELLHQMLQCDAGTSVSNAPCDSSSPVERFAVEVTAVPAADPRKCAL